MFGESKLSPMQTMATGQALWPCRSFGFLWLSCVLTLLEFHCQGDFCEFSDGSTFPGHILDCSCHQFAPRFESSLRCLHLTKWQTRLHSTMRVKRSTFATTLYSYSTLTFRPVIQLIHDKRTIIGLFPFYLFSQRFANGLLIINLIFT